MGDVVEVISENIKGDMGNDFGDLPRCESKAVSDLRTAPNASLAVKTAAPSSTAGGNYFVRMISLP